ncbi:hypothetical protein [Microbulbifer halophilus]|uniref:MotA/TolQ/ExbB proton channel domain-containing protein n=1 Tax=Microbulbifer halophilus TaxID=453963 RepID=A0ABW5EAR3_9GAMM|nr:hypothetical protein [Microbulbifer halophilus]MCW8126819.1 hypothetical protein [Microbulbifer halophilus]
MNKKELICEIFIFGILIMGLLGGGVASLIIHLFHIGFDVESFSASSLLSVMKYVAPLLALWGIASGLENYFRKKRKK